MAQHKKATKNDLLRTIEENRNRRQKEHKIYSKVLGFELVVKMIPLDEMMEMLNVPTDNYSAQIDAYKNIIYSHCQLLHDKELQSEDYAEPYDVVLDVFNNDIQAISDFADKIINLYGFGELEEDVKN